MHVPPRVGLPVPPLVDNAGKPVADRNGNPKPDAKLRDTENVPFTYVPPLRHQSVIADFLDRETAQIDRLVVKQKQLIEALKERLSSAVTHAVQSAVGPVRSTGSRWYPKIPQDWMLGRIKSVCLGVTERNSQDLWISVFMPLVDHLLVDLGLRAVRRACR